ncbi:MAG TPA: CBS domain-containing protein [Gemmatimonadaceae bacterium]|nr:CBS domain-containing protein [Gemmatimonadaceae bacterium]
MSALDAPEVSGVSERERAGRSASGSGSLQRYVDAPTVVKLAGCRAYNDDVENAMRAMRAMRSEKVRRIPIVDERGSLVGIVSQADVLLKTRDTSRAGETVEQISEPGGRHAG